MIEETLDINTADGQMETFICRPERGGPYPAVFLLMDAPGIREELRDMTRRLATVGYYVLLPNLYYRAGRDTIYGPDVLKEGSPEHTRMRAVRTKMTIPPVMQDIAAMLAFVDQQGALRKGAVGCHGYCMSGPYALAAAARYPDRVVAAASTPEKLAAALSHGADMALDYTQADWRKALEALVGKSGLDLVYDPVGGAFSEPAFRSLAPGGRHLVVGFAAGEIPRLPLNLALLKRAALVGVDWGGEIRANPAANLPLMEKLAAWIGEGRLHPEPAAVFPLEKAGEVLQNLLERKSIGKPVIGMTA